MRIEKIILQKLIVAAAIMMAAATCAAAQYKPIPGYIRVNPGFEFRNDINTHLWGAAPIAPRIGGEGSALSQGQSHLTYLAAADRSYAMDGNKLTGLAAGTTNGDGLNCGQSGASVATLQSGLNGAAIPQSFGTVSGSTSATTGDSHSNTTLDGVANTSGWSVGMGAEIIGVGPTAAAPAPTVAAPTAVCTGNCVATYRYKCSALDARGGLSPASALTAAVANAATLGFVSGATISPSAGNFNWIRITEVKGVEAYVCWATSNGSSTWRMLPPEEASADRKGNTWIRDIGLTAREPNLPGSPPRSATADNLYTRITAINGATFSLANAATQTVARAKIYHDDGVLINAALAASSQVDLPAATYAVSEPIAIGAVGGASNGAVLKGVGQFSSVLQATDGLGPEPIIHCENCSRPTFRQLAIQGDAASVPIAGIQSDVNNPVGTNGGVGRGTVEDVRMTTTASNTLWDGIALTAQAGYDENNEQWDIGGGVRIANVIRAGMLTDHFNALLQKIDGAEIAGGLCGLMTLGGGSFQIINGNIGGMTAAYDYDFCVDRGGYSFDPFVVLAPRIESSSNLVRIDPNAAANTVGYVAFRYDGTVFHTGTGDAAIVDDESTSVGIAGVNGGFGEGLPRTAVIIDAPNSFLIGGRYSIVNLTCTAPFDLSDITWSHSPSISGCTPYGTSASGINISTFVPPTATFATLGKPPNGAINYCSNCTISNPCSSGGAGAIAKRLNGVWVCN